MDGKYCSTWKSFTSPANLHANAEASKRVMRPDIYMEAMKEMGVTPKVEPLTKWTFWDGGAFDAASPEKYALSFPINSVAG